MITVDYRFERLATAVVERACDLLGSEVDIIDSAQNILASTRPRTVSVATIDEAGVRVPATLHGREVQVVVSGTSDLEAVPARLTGVLIELIVNQAAMIERLPSASQLKNRFIHNLLHGSIDNEGELIREAQILGMDLTVPRSVILIDAAEYILSPGGSLARDSERQRTRRAQVIIGTVVDFFQLATDTICAYIGAGEVAVLKASNRQNLEAWVTDTNTAAAESASWADVGALKSASAALLQQLRTHTRSSITIGVGRHHPGLSGLARSYQDAGAALRLGKQFRGINRIHCLDSLGAAAFVGVADEATKIDLAVYLLGPLDDEPELLHTLTTFLDHDLSPSQTAAELFIHRNSLTYRLNKITSLIGLDPRRFDDAVQIRLALVLRSMSQINDHTDVTGRLLYAVR